MTSSAKQASLAPDIVWASAVRVDASGQPCPQPLLAMRRALKQLAPGEILHLIATDPASQRDIRSFSELSGVPLLRAEIDGEFFHYWLQQIDQ
ncbi:sulfurtransferase TusA family protein [Microbulbifer agarilyticus]|uniref:sulfurtransferase TusA family protein n=1 Tax=Microbulbifer agarilyticus TaxID=260552 RepID=UPI001C971C27|nr:sulfurtransferase TusA family protein [Microbulbifer agarilyticus]MBY6191569.1 sulfurtransferase TusA family protein [Microbulbifer agarilyticus]MCA0894138.1 sulfurtransferase TusA family protein [Microbulbifer agarilyticus]